MVFSSKLSRVEEYTGNCRPCSTQNSCTKFTKLVFRNIVGFCSVKLSLKIKIVKFSTII